MRTLVLWDIDHTLISVRGLSAEIYSTVFHQLTGRAIERVADMAGRTDRAITAETLRYHDVEPTADLMLSFTDALGRAFAARQDEIKARGSVLPGARAVLEALSARPDVVQSVLTGNMRPIAECKLSAFGLERFVDVEVGAYGLDHADRPPLVRLAQDRAALKYGERFDASRTVLVGDTPHDVRAGHQGGARVVAVASGASSEADLRAAGAEIVLTSLTGTDAAVHAILNVSRP
ncbi:haloacid dehalogenase-like hydrolase [Actinomadura litoris]|uniref:haloacid dehalogenase-like hydrolase n=1 Tax=Actinomadura litoris TaxID=2678616 RepID=UPI001FA803E5|nr:haloacid dehalogenase-like hydrolase [Actinomadura litoris]